MLMIAQQIFFTKIYYKRGEIFHKSTKSSDRMEMRSVKWTGESGMNEDENMIVKMHEELNKHLDSYEPLKCIKKNELPQKCKADNFTIEIH